MYNYSNNYCTYTFSTVNGKDLSFLKGQTVIQVNLIDEE